MLIHITSLTELFFFFLKLTSKQMLCGFFLILILYQPGEIYRILSNRNYPKASFHKTWINYYDENNEKKIFPVTFLRSRMGFK